MIPETRITKAFVSLAGEEKLFSMAEDNIIQSLKSIQSIGPSAFIASNGMRADGSATRGAERMYWWPGSEIDAGYVSDFVSQDNPDMQGLEGALASRDVFKAFANYVSNASGGKIEVEPFADVAVTKIRGEEKDVVRLGFVAKADTAEMFEEGLQNLHDAEQPERKTDYASMILPPEDCGSLTFRD